MASKKVKVSKNRKKNWRKHVNIDDVEDFLEHKRFEERTGFDSSVPDDQLFMVDTEPQEEDNNDDVPQKTTIEVIDVETIKAKKPSKLQQLANSFRLYEKLENKSKVVPMKTQKVKKITQRTKYNNDEKLVKYWTESKNQIEESKKKKEAVKKIKTPIGAHEKDFTYDLWGAEDLQVNEWIPEEVELKTPAHRFQKNSLLPSVEVPPNALSYNPDLVAHKKALDTEAYRVMKMERKENLYKPHYLNKEQAMEAEHKYFEEMCQGLPGLDKTFDAEKSSEEEDDEDEDEDSLRKVPKKTTRKQKLRRKLEQIYVKEMKLLKNKKLSEGRINQIRRYKREILEMDKKSAMKSIARKEKKLSAMYRPAKLSRNRYVEPDMPLALPSEMTDGFRKIKAGGSLLEDRFKSFQRRNIIETRVPQFGKRKYKLKKEVKRRHRPAVTDI